MFKEMYLLFHSFFYLCGLATHVYDSRSREGLPVPTFLCLYMPTMTCKEIVALWI
jgi:hypothetical protein